MAELSAQVKAKLAEKLAQLARRHAELEARLADPELAGDPSRYAEVAKEHGALARFAELHRELQGAARRRAEALELAEERDADPELLALARDELEEARRIEERLFERAAELFTSDDGDVERSVVVEIRGGTGGEEAALFAADLFRMYTRYAQKKGWQVQVLDRSVTDRGGFRHIAFSVSGQGVWRKLRYESGGHRVQRVPVTESQGRIHTSLATVAVVRITHKPTGISVKCQEESSQHKNRQLALKLLRARLYEQQQSRRKAELDELRRSQVGSGDRNERIRTYNFPQDRITDHRIGLDIFGVESVLMGECDRLFDALADWDRERRLSALAGQD